MKSIYAELLELSGRGHSGVLVTVVEKTGSGPAESGTKMLVFSDGSTSGTVGGGSIEKLAVGQALQIMKTRENRLCTYSMEEAASGEKTGMICGGNATLFFEYIGAEKHVYIFGSGHIGKALTRHLRPLNWHVTVIDDRREVLDHLEDADEKVRMDFDRFPGDMEIPDDSYFVIATYGHHHDEAVLKRLYESVPKPAYIGMIASRKKREIILKSVKKAFPEADTGVCYIPAGLDIGGSLPHEIAVSVIAEIQAVSSGKEAKHLREAHD